MRVRLPRAVLASGTRWASSVPVKGSVPGSATEGQAVAEQWLRAAADNRSSSRKKSFHGDPYEDPNEPRPVYPKRKSPMKRVKAMMTVLNQEEISRMNSVMATKIPNFQAGDVIRLRLARYQKAVPVKDPENDSPEARKEASSMEWFTGLCIARRNRGLGSSFILRNVIDGVAIERGFPTYSPMIRDAEIVGSRKVSRSKLYYLREKPLRESSVSDATRRPR